LSVCPPLDCKFVHAPLHVARPAAMTAACQHFGPPFPRDRHTILLWRRGPIPCHLKHAFCPLSCASISLADADIQSTVDSRINAALFFPE
jgi:hypothetical protein